MELSEERARAREIWRARIAEMIADNSKSLMQRTVKPPELPELVPEVEV